MSWIGGLVGMGVSGKQAARNKGLQKGFDAAENIVQPFITKSGEELKQWGEQDWEHFKQSYRPVADALVDDVNQAPDYNRYEKEATLGAARGASDADAAIRGKAAPGSGRFAAASVDVAGAKARSAGIGGVMARQRADQIATNKKLDVIDMGRPDPGATIAGLSAVVKGGADYGKYAAGIGRQANEAMGGVGKGFGKAIGSYKGNKGGGGDADSKDQYGNTYGDSKTDDYFDSQNNAFNSGDTGSSWSDDSSAGYGDGGYADGGVIRGPGTGRSDSIPAVIDGQAPARVSNGEYLITANVAKKIGRSRLNALISLARHP